MTNYGFQPESNNYSFDPYERAGQISLLVYFGLHDLLKHKRLGYRKISQTTQQERVRHGRLTTVAGQIINREYQSRKAHKTIF